MEKLKPCPFCGSDNVHLSHWTDQAYVYCANCRIRTDVYLHGGCDKKAVEAWNRAMMGATDTNVGNKIIYCKDCKYSHMTIDGLCKYCDIWFPNEEMYEDGNYFCASAEKR